MSETFPKAKRRVWGYQVAEVDELISKARSQYQNPELNLVSAASLRTLQFTMARGGYSVSAVDAAIDRLEEIFSDREIQSELQHLGEYSLRDRYEKLRHSLLERLDRPKRKRFKRAGLFLKGYHPKQVDSFCERIDRRLSSGGSLAVTDVRRVLFKAKRGGYAEGQVDAYLDKVVETLQVERNLPPHKAN